MNLTRKSRVPHNGPGGAASVRAIRPGSCSKAHITDNAHNVPAARTRQPTFPNRTSSPGSVDHQPVGCSIEPETYNGYPPTNFALTCNQGVRRHAATVSKHKIARYGRLSIFAKTLSNPSSFLDHCREMNERQLSTTWLNMRTRGRFEQYPT